MNTSPEPGTRHKSFRLVPGSIAVNAFPCKRNKTNDTPNKQYNLFLFLHEIISYGYSSVVLLRRTHVFWSNKKKYQLENFERLSVLRRYCADMKVLR